jgi:hypothetical protein
MSYKIFLVLDILLIFYLIYIIINLYLESQVIAWGLIFILLIDVIVLGLSLYKKIK